MRRTKMTTRISAILASCAFIFAFVSPPASRADSKLRIMTATTDLAALAQEIGGEKVDVESVARGYQDPHFVEAKPSFLLKLRHADLLIVVGLELEIGWLPPLGSPHYWLDPENGLRIAKGIRDKLSEMRSSDAAYFAQRYDSFEQRLKQADEKWLAEMKPYAGRKVVTYHRSWPNFAEHFGLNVVGYVEPRPGIPPSPQHTVELIALMKRDGVKIIIVEPYFDLKTPNSVARQTGGQVVVLMPSVGGEKEITDYFKLFDYDTAKLKQAFDTVH